MVKLWQGWYRGCFIARLHGARRHHLLGHRREAELAWVKRSVSNQFPTISGLGHIIFVRLALVLLLPLLELSDNLLFCFIVHVVLLVLRLLHLQLMP